jgi:hypothetical protein
LGFPRAQSDKSGPGSQTQLPPEGWWPLNKGCERPTRALPDVLAGGERHDERNDAHFPLALRAPQRVGIPHLLDQLAPLLRRDAARLVDRNVDHFHGVALGLRFFVRLLAIHQSRASMAISVTQVARLTCGLSGAHWSNSAARLSSRSR